MKFLLYTTISGRAGSIQLSRPAVWGSAALGLCVLLLGAAAIGYQLGRVPARAASSPDSDQPAWTAALQEQRKDLARARDEAQNHLNALALRLGQMQAQLLRVEALGQKLTEVAKLDASEFDFDQLPVKNWTWGNGLSRTLDFDTRGLLIGQTLLTDQRVLGYDEVGQLSSLDDGRPASAVDYAALLPAQGLFTSAIDPGSNRLDGVSGPTPVVYARDAAGNTLGDGAHSYGYDDRGRLNSVDSGTTATYAHNGQGQRVKKVAGASTVLFVYENGNLIGEYDGSGTPLREHVWFNGAPVAVLSGTDLYYVHTDHLGTPRVISDGASAIWRWESTPFGSGAADEDVDGDLTPFEYPLRFPGQYFDGETGLHYNYFRTFDPSVGRYLESDPIGLRGGLNTYEYVVGNPLSYVDPFGLQEAPPRSSVAQYCLQHPRECAEILAASGGAYVAGQQLSDISSNTSSTSTTSDPENCPDDDDEKQCEKYKNDARRLYNDLAIKRIPQYMTAVRGGGADMNHHMSIIQRQSALRLAVDGVKRYCKRLPVELAKWERLAFQEFPMRHAP